ncbi:gas vesicle protein [Burkholderia oklahomensis]|uniref:gas vesicle protein n=1 Tax=Burkholderia oklahomensis TaxID=342113 RepID=UPI00264EB542|nr:gas vesicle protein [Burkholderia oklahomensis]MDN7672532.1 gas vesicle protein [Burkholderia oklahomensis]
MTPPCSPPSRAVRSADGEPVPVELAERLSLCEALDRILNKGAVISAHVVVSVAGVDLLCLHLRLLLSSVETALAGRAMPLEQESR